DQCERNLRLLDVFLAAVAEQCRRGRRAFESFGKRRDRLADQCVGGTFLHDLIALFRENREQLRALMSWEPGAAPADSQLAFPTSSPGNDLFVQLRANCALPRRQERWGARV